MDLLSCGTEHCVLRTGHIGDHVNKSGIPFIGGSNQIAGNYKTVHNERSPTRTVEHSSFDEISNHPTRYNAHPSGIECITIVEHMPFNIGNAIKYLWRSGLKENAPTEQDLDKAIWYIQREKERLKNAK